MATATPAPAVQDPAREQPPPSRRRRWLPWVAAPVVVVVALGIVAWRFWEPGPAPLTPADVNRAVQAGIQKQQQQDRQATPDATSAYQRILPSLVTIVASTPGDPKGNAALGAGVVVDAKGEVLTALHVVDRSTKIEVAFADGSRSAAMVATRQPENDIAVLTLATLPQVVVPAVLGGAGQVGAEVFPVGNPLGLEASLSAGVVSALNRTVRAENGRELKGLIQFDAAVNPGNSGGPLLDRDGHVLGIVTGLANPARQAYFVGIGFAVPIATAGGAAGGPQK